jgi:hypothetical protein
MADIIAFCFLPMPTKRGYLTGVKSGCGRNTK